MIDSDLEQPLFLENTGGNPAVRLNMADGNYNQFQFITELESQLNTISAANGNSFAYQVSFDSKTNKMTISSNEAVPTGFLLTLNISDPAKQAFARYIGSSHFALITYTGSWTSPFPSNFQRYENVQVRSDICQNGDNDILLTLHMGDSPYYDTVQYTVQDPNFTKCTLANNRKGTYQFRITDEWGESINMQGQSAHFTIGVWYE